MTLSKSRTSLTVLVSAVLAVALIACGTDPFKVKQEDGLVLSENNRISTKSVAGGIHVDDAGVYLNPFRLSNGAVGLQVVNRTSYNTASGGPNQLGLLERVSFTLGDGTVITSEIGRQKNRAADTVDFNVVGRYASYEKHETGIAPLTRPEFLSLANAEAISCTITGTRRSVTYAPGDVSPAFLANLRAFAAQYLK